MCWRNFGTISLARPLTFNLILKVKCQVNGYGCVNCSGRLAIVWDYFDTRADTISGRCPVPVIWTWIWPWRLGQRSWQYKLAGEARYHLGRFWYTCERNFRTISGTPFLDLEFDLNGSMPGQRSWLFEWTGRLPVAWDHLGTRTDIISGRYAALPFFDIEFDHDEGQCQVKAYGCLSCPGRLATI